jgi:hypothetical protein
MELYKCNSCGATYQAVNAKGESYQHICPVDRETEPAEFDAEGKMTRPAKREPFPNRRDERHVPGAVTIDGKHFVFTHDPNDSQRVIQTEIARLIVSEGEGRTLLEKS